MPIEYNVQNAPERDMAILKIKGDLDVPERANFRKAIDELFSAEASKLVIDLTLITRLSSLFIGTLIDQALTAQKQKKSLSIVMVEQVAKICRETGLGEVATLVVHETKKRQWGRR